MKKTLFLAVAAVTALFSACSCDELATNGAADGNMVNVTFSADLDQALVTRGVAGESDGTAATKLYVAVYNKDKQLIEAISHIGTTNSQAIETVSGKAATVNFQLVKGQTYSFVFWAQNPNATTGAVVLILTLRLVLSSLIRRRARSMLTTRRLRPTTRRWMPSLPTSTT